MIIAEGLNFRMAASHFSSVTQDVKNLIGENSILYSTKDVNKFGITLVMIVEQSPDFISGIV